MHHPDEIFQIYEFAGLKLNFNKVTELPWEYAEKMRSGILPLLVYCVSKIFISCNVFNPFVIACFFRCFASTLSFIAIYLLTKKLIIKKVIPNNNAVWLVTLLFWPVSYFHARYSSENISTTIFIFALVFILNNQNNVIKFLFVGFLFGLAFHIRFHVIFMILGCMLWLILINKISIKIILQLGLGFLIALFVGVIIDYWLYNDFVFSPYNYLAENIFNDKASYFGTQPFYFFISESVIQLIPPFSIVVILGIVLFWFSNKKHLFTYITFPFVLIHFFVGHKELRFLFPILNFIPLMVYLYYIQYNKVNFLKKVVANKLIINGFIIVNSISLLILAFIPASLNFRALQVIYNETHNKKTILIYKGDNIYNKNNSLNYFRNKQLKLVSSNDSMFNINSDMELYYLECNFNKLDTIKFRSKTFTKYYSSLPNFVENFNFNNWLQRANCYTLYRY